MTCVGGNPLPRNCIPRGPSSQFSAWNAIPARIGYTVEKREVHGRARVGLCDAHSMICWTDMLLPGAKLSPSIACFQPAKITGVEDTGSESTRLLHRALPICSKTARPNQITSDDIQDSPVDASSPPPPVSR